MVIFTDIEPSGPLIVGEVSLLLLLVGVTTIVARLADVSGLAQAAARTTTAPVHGTSRLRDALPDGVSFAAVDRISASSSPRVTRAKPLRCAVGSHCRCVYWQGILRRCSIDEDRPSVKNGDN